MRWFARAGIAVASATLSATLSAALVLPGSAAAAAPVDYAALGDSYSSGVGAPPYLAGGCTRSNTSYAAQWAATHQVTSFAFAACGGATTDDVRANQLGSLSANTDLVTITIGGNDVGFADAVISCTFGSDSACERTVSQGSTTATTVLPGKLDATYADIRARAPSARVVVLGYPRLVAPNGSCLSARKRTALNNGADVLSGVIAGRAAAAGFTYVDARPAFATHGACGSSPWINRFSLLRLVESYHPNAAGYTQGYLVLLNSVTG